MGKANIVGITIIALLLIGTLILLKFSGVLSVIWMPNEAVITDRICTGFDPIADYRGCNVKSPMELSLTSRSDNNIYKPSVGQMISTGYVPVTLGCSEYKLHYAGGIDSDCTKESYSRMTINGHEIFKTFSRGDGGGTIKIGENNIDVTQWIDKSVANQVLVVESDGKMLSYDSNCGLGVYFVNIEEVGCDAVVDSPSQGTGDEDPSGSGSTGTSGSETTTSTPTGGATSTLLVEERGFFSKIWTWIVGLFRL